MPSTGNACCTQCMWQLLSGCDAVVKSEDLCVLVRCEGVLLLLKLVVCLPNSSLPQVGGFITLPLCPICLSIVLRGLSCRVKALVATQNGLCDPPLLLLNQQRSVVEPQRLRKIACYHALCHYLYHNDCYKHTAAYMCRDAQLWRSPPLP
jgi:hypothetical protein